MHLSKKKKIGTLCKIIYGNGHIFLGRIEMIHKRHTEREQLTHQITISPHSISKLSDQNIYGIK
ncbi:BID domain-containing T4SS effector [Bartonella fuyuanensis]|uniref:BID domain-containing T4SS effector n=1 Tax=Bartonella fuyuanensis TaxID=1460968 RepID=UPI0031B634BB